MATFGSTSVNDAHVGVRVIVVDDDPDIRDLFVELLQMNNVNVVGTGVNGHEALELYKTHRPDFVLLDYLMPQYDGQYAIEKIREFDPNGKIILVSGSYFENGGLGDNVKAIIKKPIEMSDILNAINGTILSASSM
jgi:two-component system, chemotaxis family, chemotaxis protein CheY